MPTILVHITRMSSQVRGVGEADTSGKPVKLAMPDVLVRLALESHRMFTY